MLDRLPPEMIDQILRFQYDMNQNNLPACALVCKTIGQRAQTYLDRRISITTSRKAVILLDWLENGAQAAKLGQARRTLSQAATVTFMMQTLSKFFIYFRTCMKRS